MANKTATLKNQAGDNIYPNIVGDNRNAAIKDSTTIKHTLAENKISLDLDEAIKGKIDAALQKPTGLTKTKLVGVGVSGQENIEIGDNLTLANGKLSAAGGSSIPVVEGTEAQLTDEERNTGITSKYTIPAAQTASFILHTSDELNIFVNVISNRYASIIALGNDWAVLSGSDTVIYIKPDTPTTIYSTSIEGYLPTDEATTVDITFPAFDRLRNPICVVEDRDNTKVFIKNRDSHNLGRFQTPIIYKDDGTYRCWYITRKEGDDTGTLATVKCKIVSMGGGSNIDKLDIEFTTNGNTTLTSEQVALIKSYANQYVYVKLSSGLVADNAYLGYVFDLGDLGTFISIVSQPNINGNIIIQSLISIQGTTATHKENTIVFSSTNSGKFLKTDAQGNPEWASIPTATITFED